MIVKKFEEQVEKFRHRPAIKAEDNTLTYGELNRYANRICRHISGQAGADKIAVIGLLFEHGPDMIAAVLGALKAGKIYVPLSVDYPENRLSYMLSHSQATLILTTRQNLDLAGRLARAIDIGCLAVDGEGADVTENNPQRPVKENEPAYIMYTSGSTGQPKGVIQTHKNVMYYTRNWMRAFSITEKDRLTLLSSFCHDGSVQDMFSALLTGATLYPYYMRTRERGRPLVDFLDRERITLWHSVPSLFGFFAGTLPGEKKFPHLRYIVLGGEEVREHEVRMFKEHFPAAVLANVYGQTESSVDSIRLIRQEDDFEKSLLGKSLDETKVFVVDQNGHEVEALDTGVILVASRYISPGYWRDEETGRKVFIDDEEFGRLYWTGDMGRSMLNGDIEFMGRADNQVKIRGIRIELGEIESQFLRYPGILETVVLAHEGENPADKFLCAYFVAEGSIETAALRDFLAREVPDYMIPSFFIPLEKMPLTQSNKIDRRALPSPGRLSGREYRAPRDEVEEKLARLWLKVLGVERVGLDDHFFELGGHSLKAVSLLSGIHEAFDVEVPLREVFNNPHLRGLADYIRGLEKNVYVPISAAEKREYYPLSSAQKRMFVLQQLEPEGTSYNISSVLQLEGKILPGKFRDTFSDLITRQESLRTSFFLVGDEPVQRVHERVAFELEVFSADGRGGQGGRGGQELIEFIIQRFVRPFDLAGAPLLHVGLVRLAEDKHLLMLDMHHIVTDGTSMGILAREFMARYSGQEFSPLKLHYKDYAAWQQHRRESGEIDKQEKYWLSEFTGDIPVLQLPYDYPRPAIQGFEGQTVGFQVGSDRTRDLKNLAASAGATLYMVLLAAFSVLLARLSGQEDIVIGTPTAGRLHADLEGIIGMFINTLGIRSLPADDKSFLDYLAEVKQKTLSAFENQEYPFEELVDRVELRRDASRNPLFDVVFVLQNMDLPRVEMAGLALGPYPYENRTAKFDLGLTAVEAGDMVRGNLEYCTRLFKAETVTRFIGYFLQVIQGVIAGPGIKIGDIDILSAEEREQLLMSFNDTDKPYPGDKSVPELFVEQVERTPDRIALSGLSDLSGKTVGADNYSPLDNSLSYSELDRRAESLAGELMEKGGCPNTIVGIKMERSIEMIIGVMGILKAGGAYLPLDPDFPQERIDYMLADSGAEIVLDRRFFEMGASAPLSNRIASTYNLQRQGDGAYAPIPVTTGQNCAQFCLRLHELRAFRNSVQHARSGDCCCAPCATNNLAYIIYTSGSTGRPKGTLISHYSLINLCCWHNRVFRLTPSDRTTQYASPGFDASVWEIFPCLLAGANLHIIPASLRTDMSALNVFFERHHITVAFLPTQAAQLFLDRDNRSLRLLLTGGDQLKTIRSQRYIIVNNYGPTENTVVGSSVFLTGESVSTRLPIGRPIDNVKIYILSRAGILQPIGAPGELYIGGDGLARGYLNNPELTAEKFRPSPPFPPLPFEGEGGVLSRLAFPSPHGGRGVVPISGRGAGVRGDRLYRTGDLARWLDDGTIEFLGRIDFQVKIRGFRIELGEIESRLLKHPLIKETLVLARDDESGQKYLCAYLVTEAGQTPEPQVIREFLRKNLPDYMIPAHFVFLDRMPLTATGKVDRKTLPLPGLDRADRQIEAPQNAIEEKLVKVWQEVLGYSPIGANDHFFELGGDSIKAIQVSARLKRYDLDIKVRDLFLYPNLRELARMVKEADLLPVADQGEVSGEVPLTPIQHWFFESRFTDAHHFNQSLMLYGPGGFDEEVVKAAFTRLIGFHDALRLVFLPGEDGRVTQWNRGSTEGPLFDWQVWDGRGQGADVATEVERLAQAIQGSIDLEQGPLVKLGLFKTDQGDHLLIAIHHLVVDGFSWRVLLEDLALLYRGLKEGKEVKLPQKTHSFRYWAERQLKYSQDERLLKELDYWAAVAEAGAEPMRRPNVAGEKERRTGKLEQIELVLGEEETGKLIREVNRAFTTEVNDLLLTALALALRDWCGLRRVVINLEGHGREEIGEWIDVGRTVGWFTSQYPVVFRLEDKNDLGYTIKQVKEVLRRVPNKGIGYGILRYLTPAEKKTGKNLAIEPEISFNYLGQFDQDVPAGSGVFGISPLRGGENVSPLLEKDKVLDINGLVAGGRLAIKIGYRGDDFDRPSMERFAGSFKQRLLETIDLCLKKEERELTPADMDYGKALALEQLDELEGRFSNLDID